MASLAVMARDVTFKENSSQFSDDNSCPGLETVSEAFSMGTSASSKYVFNFYPDLQMAQDYPILRYIISRYSTSSSRRQSGVTLKLKGYGTVPEFLPGSIA